MSKFSYDLGEDYYRRSFSRLFVKDKNPKPKYKENDLSKVGIISKYHVGIVREALSYEEPDVHVVRGRRMPFHRDSSDMTNPQRGVEYSPLPDSWDSAYRGGRLSEYRGR